MAPLPVRWVAKLVAGQVVTASSIASNYKKDKNGKTLCTVRKKTSYILRFKERMQFSMTRKSPLRKHNVKHSKMRNFTFNAPWPEKTNEQRLGANQYPLNE
jgi:hypothetical protein